MRRVGPAVLLLFLALTVLLDCPGRLWASEGGGGGADFLVPRVDLTFWTIVVFGVLLLVLRKFAWGPILEGLQKREQAIQNAIDEAHQARAEAQRLKDQLQGELDRAHEKVRDILEQGRRDTQQATDAMISRARAEIQTERERLRREIDLARDSALQELWSQTARLASLISAKVIRRHLTPEDHQGLVQEAIAELGATAARRTG